MGFYGRLQEDLEQRMLPALLDAVSQADIERIDAELREYAGPERLGLVAGRGLRGELVYATPYLLGIAPRLLGYYRLLLGFSQKEFYNKGPFGCFKLMEDEGRVTLQAEELMEDLCRSLTESAWVLVSNIPEISHELLQALTLLTVGAEYRGSYNALLGQKMIRQVFQAVRQIVADAIEEETDTSLVIRNAAGRAVRIEFAPDPDIAIREQLDSGRLNNRIAIEVKGGHDVSNIHNRLGEAEKSHQKARHLGFNQFWTLVNVPGMDLAAVKTESPTTTQVFQVDEIAEEGSEEHRRFRELLIAELGIPA
ncbi:MAG: XcyI family restriction endonuclease [Armatimonadota bacterium]|nr:XcyI family restriction endonuclease [Armatimonadota bacterium]